MTDASADFFRQLAGRGHEPLLEKVNGTIRFDLVDGTRIDCWLVTLDKGDVSVSRENVAADLVVHADRALFDAITRGEVNGMAAHLRGEVTFDGDTELMALFQRVLPGPAPRRAQAHCKGNGKAQR